MSVTSEPQPPAKPRAHPVTLGIFIVAPFLFGLLAVLLGQDANWDLRNYHWYNAYAFLNGRFGFDLLPSQTPYFYNPTIDVPFYLLATHVPAWMAGFMLGWVQGLNFILLFLLAHTVLIIRNERHKAITCTFLAALGMLGGGGIAQLGTVFYDNVTSLGLFTSALLVVCNMDRLLKSSGARAFTLAFLFGIPAGLMMGLKLPSVIFCIGLCFAFLFTGGSLARRFILSFAFGLGVLAGTFATLGHWMLFLQENFGSPLFPYFNQYFKAPLAPLTSARDVQFIPGGIKDNLLFPFLFAQNPLRVGEIEWRDWRIPVLYGLLPAAAFLHLIFKSSAKRAGAVAAPAPARYLLWSAVFSYAVWLDMFCIYRYAIPLEMLAPLLIVLATGLLPFSIRARAVMAAALLLAIAVTVQPGNWHRRDTWLQHFVEAKVPPLKDPADIMILMAGFEPYSHVLTGFPPEIPFVRIQSNFASPDQTEKRINEISHRWIGGHKGRFMLLIPPWQKNLAADALAYFNLAIAPQPCQTVKDRLYDDSDLALCDVRRLPPKPAENP